LYDIALPWSSFAAEVPPGAAEAAGPGPFGRHAGVEGSALVRVLTAAEHVCAPPEDPGHLRPADVAGDLVGSVAGDMLTLSVIAASGIPFGVFVSEHEALGFQYRDGREILRCDHFQRGLLALKLCAHRGRDLRVDRRHGMVMITGHGKAPGERIGLYLWYSMVIPRSTLR
jgi:hypothetical protein